MATLQVFGAGGFARDLARAFTAHGDTVTGFLTSGPPAVDTLDGLPVHQASASTLAEGPVAIGVFNRESHSDYAAVAAWLRARRPDIPLLWPQDTYARLQPTLGERFWLAAPAQLAAQAHDIAAARALFDPVSHATFDALIAFRQHAHDAPPPPDPDLQYLPDWLAAELATRGPMRLVDGGAYRGETLTALAARLPIAQAWSFEPDPDNHAALVAALADWPIPATHIPAGLSDHCGLADFQAGAGEASHFGGQGGRPTPVVSLDACLHLAPVNFIKLDVEGQELAVLAGARRTLQRERPTLAIAAYHRWDDLWRLPLFLAELGLGYRLRLGLHGHNSFDTVLYAY